MRGWSYRSYKSYKSHLIAGPNAPREPARRHAAPVCALSPFRLPLALSPFRLPLAFLATEAATRDDRAVDAYSGRANARAEVRSRNSPVLVRAF